MIDSQYIKKLGKKYGADLIGIGDISYYEEFSPRENAKNICPTARCIIGIAFRIPKGIIKSMENGSQPYNYTSLGIKALAEEKTTVFLMRMARIIEDAGYEACIQRTSPNIQIRDNHGTNPEVKATYRLDKSISVDDKKPEPDVLLDFDKAGVICGLGSLGYRGNLITPQYGPMQRLAFIITNAPLECDPVFEKSICDSCNLCISACPGNTIGIPNQEPGDNYDKWSCSVYYRGAHKSNPMIDENFLKGNPERDAIINGEKKFNSTQAKEMYKEMDFMPNTQYGYVPCLCGKKCDVACFQHLSDIGIINPNTKKQGEYYE